MLVGKRYCSCGNEAMAEHDFCAKCWDDFWGVGGQLRVETNKVRDCVIRLPKSYEIDFDKVKSLEDLMKIMKVLFSGIIYDDISGFSEIKDFVREVK